MEEEQEIPRNNETTIIESNSLLQSVKNFLSSSLSWLSTTTTNNNNNIPGLASREFSKEIQQSTLEIPLHLGSYSSVSK